MKEIIESSNPLFFERDTLIYFDDPDNGLISEESQYLREHHEEITELLRKKDIDYINFWHFLDMTYSDVENASKEMSKFYPYWVNFKQEDIIRLYSKMIEPIDEERSTTGMSTRKIILYFQLLRDEFQIDLKDKSGFLCISRDEILENNTVKLTTIFGKSKNNLIEYIDFISSSPSFYHEWSNEELAEEIIRRQEFFRSISNDPYALRFLTELVSGVLDRHERPEMIRTLEMFDDVYILRDRFRLSRLRVDRNYDDHRYLYNLIDYENKIIILEPISETPYILYLLKHSDGYNYPQLKDRKEELERIYMKITGSDDLEPTNEKIERLTEADDRISVEVSNIKKKYRDTGLPPCIYEYYTITGKTGRIKSIILPSELLLKDSLLQDFRQLLPRL